VSADYERIWLQPRCDRECGDERTWCRDNVWSEGCDPPACTNAPTEYVRADLVATLRAENARLREALNTPELHDFAAGVVSEAQHQRQRWGAEHDAGKAPEDWFWLLGYLAGKALHAAKAGDMDKALHHTISTAAALANWHAAMLGSTNMRPGIGPGSAAYPAASALDPQGCVSASPTGCVSDSECAAAGHCLERPIARAALAPQEPGR
jgi:hypothetical protein